MPTAEDIKSISCIISTFIIQNGLPMVFEANGEIHWCICLGEPEGIIGNYKTNYLDVEKIYTFEKRTVFDNEECRACPIRYLCGGGCMINTIGQRKEPVTGPSCNIFSDDELWENLELFIQEGKS